MKKAALDIGKNNDRYFISSVSMGTIPASMQEVSAEEKTDSGILAYLKKGLEAMRDAEGYTFVLNLDEEEITVASSFVLVALGNGVGGMKEIMPDATLRDGKLHLLALKGDSIAENWTAAPKMLTGNLVEDDRILYRTFS